MYRLLFGAERMYRVGRLLLDTMIIRLSARIHCVATQLRSLIETFDEYQLQLLVLLLCALIVRFGVCRP